MLSPLPAVFLEHLVHIAGGFRFVNFLLNTGKVEKCVDTLGELFLAYLDK